MSGSGDSGITDISYRRTAAGRSLTAEAARRAAELDKRRLQDGTAFPHDNPSPACTALFAAVEPPVPSQEEEEEKRNRLPAGAGGKPAPG